MKKNPYANPHNKKPKKYRKKQPLGPYTYTGKIRTGMTPGQKRNMNKFMAVREGETEEQWRKRTAHRRVIEYDEALEHSYMSKVRVMARAEERKSIEIKNRFVLVKPLVKDFDFMRYYGIVINYSCIKYGISVEDLQMGFYFYSNIPFTKERFNNAAVLHYGTNHKKLSVFIKNGYIEEILFTKKVFERPDKIEKTNLYKLTKGFVALLTYIYRTLARMNGIRIPQPTLTPLPPEAKQIIMDMNDEIMDIQTGRKPRTKI